MSNEKINEESFLNETALDEEPPSHQRLVQKRINNLKKNSERIINFHHRDLIRISDTSKEFYKKHFPFTTESEWQDWKWQIKNSITDKAQLQSILGIEESEADFFNSVYDSLPLRITPHYASLISQSGQSDKLRKCVIPIFNEFISSPGETADPLNEEHDSPLPNLIHRYPDRVLLLVTGFCSTFCRYCTRSRVVAHDKNFHFGKVQLEKAFEYISSHPEIRDVLISGGDPLTLNTNHLEFVLAGLRKIKHIEFIRIGTKVPVVLPQRITTELLQMFRKYHPLWLSIHFTHADEITPEVKEACERLADAGIPLGSQTVLLKDVNDDIFIMKELMHALLKIRVRPYYLYQCDPITGSSHFRTPIEKGIEIIKGLRGNTTGYAIPTFVVDAPGGGGKIPLLPDNYLGKEDGNVLLRNYEGKIFRYPDVL